MNSSKNLSEIKTLASENQEIIVAWLYDSRARNTAHEPSDFDIAIAFEKPINNVLDMIQQRRYQDLKGFSEHTLSVLDPTSGSI